MILFWLICSYFCLSNVNCVVPIAANYEPRVINGEDAVLGQFPYHVGVISVLTNKAVLHQCSGAIISEEWILTAAHCVDGADTVSIHASTVNNFINDGINRTSKQFIVHEDFDSSTLQNDIALIQVDAPINFNENVSSIALSDIGYEHQFELIVTGWGHSNHDDTNNETYVLQYGNVLTFANMCCELIYGTDVVQQSNICTEDGSNGTSPCFGDGGAPLVFIESSGPGLIGILSFFSSLGCGKEYPTGYTRVASYTQWIQENSGI